VAQPLEVEGYRFIDVTDPDTEETFRFYEVEYSVACAMNGARDIEGLIRWSKEELGLEPTRDELATVVETLSGLGYLAADDLGLGAAGRTAAGRAPAGTAPSFDLGAPGSPLGAAAMPAPAAAAVELGAPGGGARMAARPPEESFAGLGDDRPPLGPAGGVSELTGAARAGRPPPRPMAAVAAAAARRGPSLEVDADEPPTAPGLGAAAAHLETRRQRQRQPAPTPPEYSNEDVSVDLSDHLQVGAADLKEAVRASQTMDVPALPDADEGLDLEPEMSVGERPELDVEAPRAAASGAAPIAINRTAPSLPPVEAPVDDSEATADAPAAARGGGALLVALALVLLVGGAGAAYYFFVYRPGQEQAKAPPRPRPAAVAPAARSPGPPAAELVEAAPELVPVLTDKSGLIDWMRLDGDKVERGEPVVRFDGWKRAEERLERPRRRLEEYSIDLAKAQAAGSTSRITRFEAKVAEKQALVDEGEAALAELTVVAPASGTVRLSGTQSGERVETGAEVARIELEPRLQATFSLGDRPRSETDACQIAAQVRPDQPLECELVSIGAGAVVVRVGRERGLAAGERVILK
jgi:biotin carboxyl carrier protein